MNMDERGVGGDWNWNWGYEGVKCLLLVSR